MDSLMALLRALYEFVHAGFSDVKSQVLGLVIAVLAAIVMTGWGRLLVMSVGAAIAHILIEALLPLAQGQGFVMPDIMAGAFWGMAAGMTVGYLILIAAFFFIKHNVLRLGGAGKHSHAH